MVRPAAVLFFQKYPDLPFYRPVGILDLTKVDECFYDYESPAVTTCS